MKIEIRNAEIKSAEIQIARGFILEANLDLDFQPHGMTFGGFVLGSYPDDSSKAGAHHTQPNFAADFIAGILQVAGVERWSQLPGRIIRIRGFFGDVAGDRRHISAIGHAVKDLWYEPEARFGLLGDRQRDHFSALLETAVKTLEK